jgi:1-acyl-sn-glycerol-3-phosphate acyltransferase
MRLFRVGATVVVLAIVTFALMPLQWLAIARNWPLAARLPRLWQRIACRVAGIRVRVEGAPAKPPLLLASNHISWLDIPVLGSVLPVSFVAKAEVGTWPVVGMLARLQRTIFIDRTRRSQTGSATAEIAHRVERGDVMVLFAEGTTGDGNRLLPFRSALLGAARGASGSGSIIVQPVAITYSAIHGLPVGYTDRPSIAWYGDMKLIRHFAGATGRGGLDVIVSFGEPIAFGAGEDRKKVAEECFNSVRRMIDEVRRQPLPAGRKGRRRLFSGSAKGAKGTADIQPGSRADRPGESIISRIS